MSGGVLVTRIRLQPHGRFAQPFIALTEFVVHPWHNVLVLYTTVHCNEMLIPLSFFLTFVSRDRFYIEGLSQYNSPVTSKWYASPPTSHVMLIPSRCSLMTPVRRVKILLGKLAPKLEATSPPKLFQIMAGTDATSTPGNIQKPGPGGFGDVCEVPQNWTLNKCETTGHVPV